MKEIDALRAARDYIKSLPGPLTLDRYNTLDKINAAIAEANSVPQVPCPVCGGEAKDHQDALRRVYFMPTSLVAPATATSCPPPTWSDFNDLDAIDAILRGDDDKP